MRDDKKREVIRSCGNTKGTGMLFFGILGLDKEKKENVTVEDGKGGNE
ncbi:MAG: hypothetical protein ACXVI3_06275 [Halobacteriota archaeon]